MTQTLEQQLTAIVGTARVAADAPLAPLTTFKVGGNAEWLVQARSGDEVRRIVEAARRWQQPITALGGGSNVLIADTGLRGIVIRIHGGGVEAIDAHRIQADAGITINGLVRWTVGQGISGLEAWAGTPGTVGGAIHGNAHFRGRLIGDLVERVTLVAGTGEIVEVPAAAMEFGYDYSRLHHTREIVVAAVFRVGRGDPAALRATARESLAFRKRTQPLESASAGCIFQNPNPVHDVVPPGIPASAGALVDRAGLKNAAAGRARVSTTHANFIVNEGGATAADIRALIDRCKQQVGERFGVALREEIVYLGFGGETARTA
jgi:UDP-N-acetylmuramate dehydrogenase